MCYWFFRHDKTHRHEIAGGYIWLPKKKTGETILGVAAGDGILSCVDGHIGHAGRAAEHAVGERGRSGDGWWLPVDWTRLPDPVTPATPPREGLTEMPEDAFHAILAEAGATDWPFTPPDDPATAAQVAASRLDYDPALAASVRDQQVKARRGQSLFRFRVFQIEAPAA